MQRKFWKIATVSACLALCLGTGRAQLERVSFEAMVEAPEGQVQDDLLQGLDKLGTNAKERNEINLDKSMMALAGSRKGGRYADLSQKMDFIVIRNYEFATKDQYPRADVDALRHKLEGAGWSHIVRNESDRETNEIVVKPAADGAISDMVILNAEPRELNIVHLRGHFRIEDVNSALGATIGLGAGTFGMAGAMGHVAAHAAVPPVPAAPSAPPAVPVR